MSTPWWEPHDEDREHLMATIPVAFTYADNTIATAAQFNAQIKDAQNFLKSVPRAQVMHNALITRPTQTSWSLVPWNLDIDKTDGGGMHSTVTNNSRVIALTAGVYHCWVNITWEDHAIQAFDGDRGVQIRKNSAGNVGTGTLVGVDHRHCFTNPTPAVGASQHGCEGYIFLAVNDYIETFVYDADNDTSGGPVGCYLDPAVWFAQRFGMRWVSA
jgi:hypothetical protein